MQKNVKLDALERVHIPKKVMELLQWEAGDLISLEVEGNKIILSKGILPHRCPSCSKLFDSSFEYCPFDGQALISRDGEQNESKE